MYFRPIQPFPTDNDDGAGRSPAKKRVNAIRVACDACRKAKAKCDGTRPRCQVCISKNRECVFRGEEGQSRETILKSRIELLEQQILALQASQAIQLSSSPPVGPDGPEEPEAPEDTSAIGPITQQARSTIELIIPSTPVTKRAIDGFFSCSGKLFHVFSRAQVSSIVDSVYKEADNESEGRNADIGSLMAVAAVGSQYTSTGMENEVQERFYNVARYYLDAVITQRPLEAIKVITLLCMYNVFGKATVSLAYADAGLGMCDRYGLHCQRQQVDGITESTWLDYRKAWRTLVFLATWLSTTLGYKTGNYKVIQQISDAQLQIDSQPSISEVVQTEMTRISLLKARILHMHLAFKHLATEPLNSMIQDLQDWYEKLPAQMQLQSLSKQDIPLEARRSIYHVHLLYLGANMLLFRRIAAEYTQSCRRDTGHSPLWHPSSDLLFRQGPNALLAANSSARIVKLLLDENGVFQRCWLVIFQSYTSFIIIMHAVLTKLISDPVPSWYRGEMENAGLCLEALAYCGSADPVASQFHEKAQTIHDSVLGHIERNVEELESPRLGMEGREILSPSRNITEDGPSVMTNHGSSIQTGNEDSGALPGPRRLSVKELSFDLLEMLCRPFGDPSYREGSKESLAATHRSDPTRYEHPVLMERLEWDFEDSIPFKWNSEKLGLGSAESNVPGEGVSQVTQAGNRFLDSMHPSGWT